MRVKFHQSLDELKERLLVMAGMAEQAIQRFNGQVFNGRPLALELEAANSDAIVEAWFPGTEGGKPAAISRTADVSGTFGNCCRNDRVLLSTPATYLTLRPTLS